MATRGRWLGLACLGSVLLMGSAGARSMDRVNQAKLVVFHYDANRAYTLYTRPGAVTDLELPAGETVQAMALGDSVQWVVEQSPGHVFIKPVRQGLFTSATLVTSRRTYQLILRSLKPEGVWFQRVSWTDPGLVLFQQNRARRESRQMARIRQQALQARQKSVLLSDVNPDSLNFEYRIEGHAPFRPEQVFDNGVFTWILMAPTVQGLPALFEIRNNGRTSLINYHIQGHYLKISRLMPRMLLKLGKAEIMITNRHLYHSKSLSSWFKGKSWGRAW